MEINLNTPALLFPAISLLLLAYTNRFVALASLVRKLHSDYKRSENTQVIVGQIRNLRQRLNLIRNMQALGVLSFTCCVVCMYLIYNKWEQAANYVFAASLLSLLASLIISLIEIFKSTRALELEISDMDEELGNTNIFKEMFQKK